MPLKRTAAVDHDDLADMWEQEIIKRREAASS